MQHNDTLLKIQQLMNEREWSIYKLSKASSIPYSSLNSLFLKNNQPTVSTLEKLCAGLNITMSEFFADNTPFREVDRALNDEERLLLSHFRKLGKQNRHTAIILIEALTTLK